MKRMLLKAYKPSCLILWCCCILLLIRAQGQDIIIRTDQVQLKATILKIDNRLIRFRHYEQPDSLDYVISTADVQHVVLANGVRREFEGSRLLPKAGPDYYRTDLGRNQLYFVVSDLLYQNISVAYERLSANGKVGIRVPIAVGLSPKQEYNDIFKFQNSITTGLGLNYYYLGHSRFTHYLGGRAEISLFKEAGIEYYYHNNSSNTSFVDKTAFSPALVSGLYYRFSPTWACSLEVGMGARAMLSKKDQGNNYNYYNPYHRTSFYLANLQTSYRF